MAYFSNGSEGFDYQSRWCERCEHYDEETGCPIWNLHYRYNSSQFKSNFLAFILGLFIPRSKDRLSNEKCVMFRAKGGE